MAKKKRNKTDQGIDILQMKRTVEINFSKEDPKTLKLTECEDKIIMLEEDEHEFYDTLFNTPKPRQWLLDHTYIGFELISYIQERNEEILFEILNKHLDMMFDDGTRINLSIWLVTTKEDRKRLIISLMEELKESNGSSSEELWIKNWIRVLTLSTFTNPLKDEIFRLSLLAAEGLPNDQKDAINKLEELKLHFLIPKKEKSGRNKKQYINHLVITRYKQDNPLITPLELKQEQAYCINKTYNTVLAGIQKIFKDNKRSDKRSKAFKDYIKRENMTMKLAKKLFPKQLPHTGKSEETYLNEVTDELLFKSVKHRVYPKDLAWKLLEAEFSLSKKTLQRLARFWKPEKLIDALPADIREKYGTKMIKDLFDIDVKYTKKS